MFTVEVKAPEDGPAPHGRDWIRSSKRYDKKSDAKTYAFLLQQISTVETRVVRI